ncbi:sulfotransferase family protein [Actinoplanes utahensis]|uniref:Sulfotransferase n=1 Tax=Actinoplanes utahensis TaxID=1869 RepID=A0A0A6UJX8_ACTUT|nr:sulfotransferase [Actinoplanes utahensis]KHD76415.1 sulfotransferase [Actinoplanes utahensis]GIF29808.1 sulfotransferase [Actinoplanes utahensis]
MTTSARTDVGTVEDLHASAARLTGLDDFGDGDGYAEGLRVLLRSYAGEAALTPAGSKRTRGLLRGALVSRLLAEAAWREFPEHARVAIEHPVFVTGLPRTGTTALHRLLTADPAHQGPELWLTEVPQPRPPRAEWEGHPVFAALREAYRDAGLDGVHHMRPERVEECWRLLCQSMTSVSFECTAYIPGYAAWLDGRDWTPAYARHRRNLQLIGLRDQGRRWVLKNPSHLFALDALFATYPDAMVIQTHRDPRTVIASVCSLTERASAGWSTVFGGPVLGRAQLSLWSRGLRRFRADRARHDPARFIDVRHADLVADPRGTVEMIYDRLGARWSPGARSAVDEAILRGTPTPDHTYDPAAYGLTPALVDAAFAG